MTLNVLLMTDSYKNLYILSILASKHISTPLFVMVAQWDSYQLTRLVAVNFKSISLPPKKHKERTYLTKFGNNTYRSIATVSNTPIFQDVFTIVLKHTFVNTRIIQ